MTAHGWRTASNNTANSRRKLVQRTCPLLAISGHGLMYCNCLPKGTYWISSRAVQKVAERTRINSCRTGRTLGATRPCSVGTRLAAACE